MCGAQERCTHVLVGRLEGMRSLGRPMRSRGRPSERIKLKWLFKKCSGWAYTGLVYLRIGTGGGRL